MSHREKEKKKKERKKQQSTLENDRRMKPGKEMRCLFFTFLFVYSLSIIVVWVSSFIFLGRVCRLGVSVVSVFSVSRNEADCCV